jgi:hypothetical protein
MHRMRPAAVQRIFGASRLSTSSSPAGVAAERYEQAKRATVWLVKQLDSHLCDLDRRIEKHIASRARARTEGNFEQIALEQNRLGELCIEHKARLDSMLFFWVFFGSLSVAGWARSALREGSAAASALREHASLASTEQSNLSLAIRHELRALGAADSRTVVEAVEAGVRAALKASDVAPPHAPHVVRLDSGRGAAGSGGESGSTGGKPTATIARAQQAVAAMDVQQWTCVAAVGACVMSGATLVLAATGRS